MTRLSARLQTCAEMVRRGAVAADVGSDHGHLAVYLLEKGICPRVVASDLRPGPLSAAKRSAQAAGVTDRMAFYLSDGLEKLPMAEIDTVILAGMGGDTIQHILADCPHLADKQLILQPQSKAAELRRWLAAEGFSLRRERLAQDGRFLYTVMEAGFTGQRQTLPPGEALLPRVLRESGDPLLRDYFLRVKEGVQAALEGLDRAKAPDPALRAGYQAAWEALTEMEGQIW